MKKQLKSISVHKTSLFLAVMYFIMGTILALFMLFVPMKNNEEKIFFLLVPFVYGIGGYLVISFVCMLYNFLAKKMGGIEFTLKDVDDESVQSSVTNDNLL